MFGNNFLLFPLKYTQTGQVILQRSFSGMVLGDTLLRVPGCVVYSSLIHNNINVLASQ